MPYDFLKLNFPHFTPHVKLYFSFYEEKRNLSKIFGLENWMESGVRKTLNFVKLSITSKIFGEINTESPVISIGLKLP